MVCSKCNTIIADDVIFCPKCGAKVEQIGEEYTVESTETEKNEHNSVRENTVSILSSINKERISTNESISNNRNITQIVTAIVMFATAIICAIHSAKMLSALGSVLDLLDYSDVSDIVSSIILESLCEIFVAVGMVAIAVVIILKKSNISAKYILLIMPAAYCIGLFGDVVYGLDLDTLIYLATIAIWLIYILPLFDKFKSSLKIGKNILITSTAVVMLIYIIKTVAEDSGTLFIITWGMQYISLILFGLFIIDLLKTEKRVEAVNNPLPTNFVEKPQEKSESKPVKQVNVEGPVITGDMYENLKQIKELLDLGIITEAEFEESKKRILNRNMNN